MIVESEMKINPHTPLEIHFQKIMNRFLPHYQELLNLDFTDTFNFSFRLLLQKKIFPNEISFTEFLNLLKFYVAINSVVENSFLLRENILACFENILQFFESLDSISSDFLATADFLEFLPFLEFIFKEKPWNQISRINFAKCLGKMHEKISDLNSKSINNFYKTKIDYLLGLIKKIENSHNSHNSYVSNNSSNNDEKIKESKENISEFLEKNKNIFSPKLETIPSEKIKLENSKINIGYQNINSNYNIKNNINNNTKTQGDIAKTKLEKENDQQSNLNTKLADKNVATYIIPESSAFKNEVYPKLTSKAKKYNDNHFERTTFIKNFLSCLKIKEQDIHNKLQNVAVANYENKRKKYEEIILYLDLKKLKNLLNVYFPMHSVYLIGSVRTGLLYDIKNRDTCVDLLLLPNVYNLPVSHSQMAKCLNECCKSLGTLDTIIKKLEYLNKLNDHPFKFLELEKVKEDVLKDFYINFKLENREFSNKPPLSVNFIIYNERLRLSSGLICKFFHNNEVLRILHTFFQEILISKLKLIKRRRDLSNLIIAFINSREKLYSETKKIKNVYCLSHKDKSLNKVRNSEMVPNFVKCFMYECDESLIKDKLKDSNLGELVLEFLRFFINYMNYIKNDYNKVVNKKFKPCNGFDYLETNYRDYLYGEKVEYYVLDHEFMKEFYQYEKIKYDNQFCKIIDNLEDIYFKICESSDKIQSYEHILDNIIENNFK
jgi:hypothetical protein